MVDLLLFVLVFLGVVCIIGFVLLLALRSRGLPTSFVRLFVPVSRKKYLLTLQETEVYEILQRALKAYPDHFIWCQVSVASLVDSGYKALFWGVMNKLKYKSIDYLVVKKNDKGTYYPIVAIELDDPTHLWAHRVARDRYIEAALENARIKLFRVKTRNVYNGEELTQTLWTYIHAAKQYGACVY